MLIGRMRFTGSQTKWWPWSTMVSMVFDCRTRITMVNHQIPSKTVVLDHGIPWSPWYTMVNAFHGQPWSPWFLMVEHELSWSTIKYHQKPWYEPWCTMVLTMVHHGQSLKIILTMVNQGLNYYLTMVYHGQHCIPWSTMV